MNAYIEIIRADGRSTIRPFDGPQLTVGSGLEANIALPDVPELESSHVLLAPQRDGCWVAIAQDAAAPAWVLGKQHENGILPWGSEIDVGSITLRINHAGLQEERRRGQRRRWSIIAALVVCLLGGSWLLKREHNFLPRRTAEPPPLLDDPSQECPEPDTQRALALAQRSLAAGNARVVRYPFDANDGVQAASLLAAAQSCFARAGEPQRALAIKRQRTHLVDQLQEDYQLHLLRLERALAQEQLENALGETRALQALLEHKDGPYRSWLVRVERHISIRLNGKLGRKHL